MGQDKYNEQVAATSKGGMIDVAILDERTPPDVLDYFIEQGNKMHGIGGKRFTFHL